MEFGGVQIYKFSNSTHLMPFAKILLYLCHLFNCYTNDKPYTTASCINYIPQSTMVNMLFPTVHPTHSALMYNRPQTRFTELNITLSSLSKSDVRDRVVYCGLGEALQQISVVVASVTSQLRGNRPCDGGIYIAVWVAAYLSLPLYDAIS